MAAVTRPSAGFDFFMAALLIRARSIYINDITSIVSALRLLPIYRLLPSGACCSRDLAAGGLYAALDIAVVY